MNGNVKVIKSTDDPPLLLVKDPELEAFLAGREALFTRIWAGYYSGEGSDPAYTCVVGELWDQDIRPKLRSYIMLDEGIALDDTAAEYPTPFDGLQAAIALKDLYSISDQQNMMRMWVSPRQKEFVGWLQRQWGLRAYPPEEEVSAEQLQEWYPYFKSRHRIGGISVAPFGEDEDHCLQVMNSLFNRKKLWIMSRCRMFDSEMQTPRKALALVMMAFQQNQWSWAFRHIQESDGYENLPLPGEEADDDALDLDPYSEYSRKKLREVSGRPGDDEISDSDAIMDMVSP